MPEAETNIQQSEDAVKRRKEYQRAWNAANRERVRACERARYKVNSAKLNARTRAYHKANREKCSASTKAYRHAHPAETTANRKAWERVNREKITADRKVYYAANSESLKAYAKAWAKANPERVRARLDKRRVLKLGATVGDIAAITAWETDWRNRKRVTCHWCCQPFPPQKCHADHVMPLSKGGAHNLSNLVVSCAFCNLSKKAKLPDEWNKELTEPVLL